MGCGNFVNDSVSNNANNVRIRLMKRRKGFVSNSSSSSFILDLRDEGVKEILKEVIALEACGLGRCSAQAVGKEAVEYANEWLKDMGEGRYDNEYGLGGWILDWADNLGEENVVFLRESDEDKGLFGEYDYDNQCNIVDSPKNKRIEKLYKKMNKLVKGEREYH